VTVQMLYCKCKPYTHRFLF